MQVITQGGETIYLINGRAPDGRVANFGITQSQTKRIGERGRTVRLTHLQKIVDPGLIVAQHVFKGLNRPLHQGGNHEGDKEKLVYSWKSAVDYDWQHARRFDESGVTERPAPRGMVFVVVATPNPDRDRFPSVDYWIENNWTWVEESNDLEGAPVEWAERYEERVGFDDN